MPSIRPSDAGASRGSGGWNIPWKVLGILSVVACSLGYGYQQYQRYFPSRKTPARPVAAAPAKTAQIPAAYKAALDKLSLTDDQKRKLAAIDAQTTDARGKLSQAVRVLTSDQRKQLAVYRNEARKAAAEARKAAQQRNEKRMAKYYPNPTSAQYAKQAQAAIQAQRQARAKAAQQTPATK